MLIVFRGLPATGKSTLAKGLAAHFGAVYLRADTVEQALRRWNHQYHASAPDVQVIDTAGRPPEACVDELVHWVQAAQRSR